MASSAEMLSGGIALLAFTFVDLVLYVISNSILAPLVQIVNTIHVTPLLGMADNTYIVYVMWAFLLLFEIMAIIAFMYIVGRRQISQSEWL